MKPHKLHIWLITGLLALSTQASSAIRSGDALTLRGAQVHGQSVQVKATGLHIQSLQNTSTSHSKNHHTAVAFTFGNGISASASHNHTSYRGNSLGIHISASGGASLQNQPIGHIGGPPSKQPAKAEQMAGCAWDQFRARAAG